MRLNSTVWHNNTKNLDHTVTAITSYNLQKYYPCFNNLIKNKL